ncbi:helicase-associated domain-containing protein [Promicromonospora sp. NPDC057138]|uniref:helicase-associated domain-containing protein n=1 Tax=Promicromonospora sp. NPDC057138 TaxID=3346031 RepID=UPI003645E4C1
MTSPAADPAVSSLHDHLRTLDSGALEELLLRRPDVNDDVPLFDLEDLAARLLQPSSVGEVLLQSDLAQLQVLEVVVALGHAATEQEVAHRMSGTAEQVADVVDRLVAGGLAWPLDPTVWLRDRATAPLVTAPAVLMLLANPLGLGAEAGRLVPSVDTTTLRAILTTWQVAVPRKNEDLLVAVRDGINSPDQVRRVLADAPDAVLRHMLRMSGLALTEGLSETLPERFNPEDRPGPWKVGAILSGIESLSRADAAWVLRSGLVLPVRSVYGSQQAFIPREVILALADPDAVVPLDVVLPRPMTAPVAPEQVERTAAAALTETLSAVMSVLEQVARTPVPLLKAGGVGVRELTRLAKRTGVSAELARFALDLAAYGELVAYDDEAQHDAGHLEATPYLDPWRRRTPAERATDLVAWWLEIPIVPLRTVGHDGKTLPAARPDRPQSYGSIELPAVLRGVTMAMLRALPDDAGVTSAESLADAVAWASPLAGDAHAVVPHLVTEAEHLGLVALGAQTDLGRSLSTGDGSRVRDTAESFVPSEQGSVLLGSDLTAMVTGSPSAALVDVLDAIAGREARGVASTWRLTPESLRQAFDDGWAADTIRSALHEVSGGKIPQAMDYLIGDVARRHGRAAVAPALAVITSDDLALLAEILAHKALKKLGLRAVAPTVLVSAAQGREGVLAALRAAGFMPISHDDAGEPVVSVARAGIPAGGELAASDSLDLAGLDGVGVDELAFHESRDEPVHEAAARLVAGVRPAGMTERPRPRPDGISAVLGGEWSDEPEAWDGPVGPDRGALIALIRAVAPRLTPDAAVVLADAVQDDGPVLVRHVSGVGAVRQTGLHSANVDEDALYGCSDEDHTAVEIPIRSVVDVLRE